MLMLTLCGVVISLMTGCAKEHVLHGQDQEVGVILAPARTKKAAMSGGKDGKMSVGEVVLPPGTVFKTTKNAQQIVDELKAKGVKFEDLSEIKADVEIELPSPKVK